MCALPRASRSAGLKLWTPSDTRVTPGDRRTASRSRVTEAGASSTVHSPGRARPGARARPPPGARGRGATEAPGFPLPRRRSRGAVPGDQPGLGRGRSDETRTDPRSDGPDRTRRSRRCWRRTGRGHKAPAARRPQLWLAPLWRQPSLIRPKWTLNEFPSRDKSCPRPARPLALAALCGCATVASRTSRRRPFPRTRRGSTPSRCASARSRTRSPDSITPHIVLGAESHDMKRSSSRPASTSSTTSFPPSRRHRLLLRGELHDPGQRLPEPEQAYTHFGTPDRRPLRPLARGQPRAGRARGSASWAGASRRRTYRVRRDPRAHGLRVADLARFLRARARARQNLQGHALERRGQLRVGTFRIDSSDVTVDPAALTLAPGGRSRPSPSRSATPRPRAASCSTSRPTCPRASSCPRWWCRRARRRSRSTVEGGKPGSGSLFLKGYGSGEVTVPVTVAARK